MDKRISVRSSSHRAPLSEISRRVNSACNSNETHHLKTDVLGRKENVPLVFEVTKPTRETSKPPNHSSQPPVHPRLSVVSQTTQTQDASKRASQVSTTSASTTASTDSKLKTHIGPWQLGKTLGKGSSARVRLARHRVTQQSVAVKIISKRTAYLSQAGSIAQLDKLDKYCPEEEDGIRRLPVTVEREIAIMKLIEHPNIIQILDVWENRNEIYIILEFCQSRDMFSWINKYGPLSEHDAIYVFRQMMCAMEYCHSFNICHRDLKPENILLSDMGDVKIIDFGMAALHQNDQNLRTSCGSPHYAAPELLKSRTYRGDKADIWSMGVILFAMLAQRLPFDDPHLPTMLSLSKRGIYKMPDEFTADGKDLIRRILVTDPDKRITIQQMWEHPLIKKYDNQPGFENTRRQSAEARAVRRDLPVSSRDVDPYILRQLRAVWHSSDIKDIQAKIASKEANDEKMFYHLLVAHRDRLLENYDPGLTHSSSDYHHLRPQAWATRVATRQFNNHGRTPSRFTVISTIADTDPGGTVRSYDPYHASRNLAPLQASRAKIVIHHGKMESKTVRSLASGSMPSRVGTRASSRASRGLSSSIRSRTVSYAQSQRSSLSSIRSSRQGTTSVLVKAGRRRGVEFSQMRGSGRRRSRRRSTGLNTTAPADEPGETGSIEKDIELQRKSSVQFKHGMTEAHGSRDEICGATPTEDDEMVRFSHSIAKDCDDAFRSSICSGLGSEGRNLRSSLTPFSVELGDNIPQRTPEPAPQAIKPWDSRPLPPTPPTDCTPSPLRNVEVKIETPSPHDDISSCRYGTAEHISVAPLKTPFLHQRRVTSAPVYAQYAHNAQPLPSILESSADVGTGHLRIVSAPPASRLTTLPNTNDNNNLDFLANAENTIRVVESPTNKKSMGLSIFPEPLNVRKKASHETNTELTGSAQDRQPRRKSSARKRLHDLPDESHPKDDRSSNGNGFYPGPKKISVWLRRGSKTIAKGDRIETLDVSESKEDQPRPAASVAADPPKRFCSTSTTAPPPAAAIQAPRKKSIMFWKSHKTENRMSIAAPDYEENLPSSDAQSALPQTGTKIQNGTDHSDTSARRIEPRQNWLARFFRVKPSMRYLCLQISCRRARQEVTILLREWRKWGIRDVEVDKDRNIVFARVGKTNFLNIKEVHLAVEIITVIEHGKRTHLSIVRFTQEKGAASSFHKVVDTMNGVFSSRGLLVQDDRKAKMMVKTLNS